VALDHLPVGEDVQVVRGRDCEDAEDACPEPAPGLGVERLDDVDAVALG